MAVACVIDQGEAEAELRVNRLLTNLQQEFERLRSAAQGADDPDSAAAKIESQRRRIAALEAEVGRLQRRLDDRALIERAKWFVVVHHGLGEPDAYRFLQKAATRKNLTLAEVCRPLAALVEEEQARKAARP